MDAGGDGRGQGSSMFSYGLDFHLNSFDVEIDLTIDLRAIKADNCYASLCRQCWNKGDEQSLHLFLLPQLNPNRPLDTSRLKLSHPRPQLHCCSVGPKVVHISQRLTRGPHEGPVQQLVHSQEQQSHHTA